MINLRLLFKNKIRSNLCCQKVISKRLAREIIKTKELLEQEYKKRYKKRKKLTLQQASDFIASVYQNKRYTMFKDGRIK